jgi:hypothetical protein
LGNGWTTAATAPRRSGVRAHRRSLPVADVRADMRATHVPIGPSTRQASSQESGATRVPARAAAPHGLHEAFLAARSGDVEARAHLAPVPTGAGTRFGVDKSQPMEWRRFAGWLRLRHPMANRRRSNQGNVPAPPPKGGPSPPPPREETKAVSPQKKEEVLRGNGLHILGTEGAGRPAPQTIQFGGHRLGRSETPNRDDED